MFKRKKFNFLMEKDDRVKVMQDRINITEKHFNEIAATFGGCSRKLAKCRDKYDELAKSLLGYSEEEDINESLNTGLKSFANAVTILADFIDLEVHRIEMKIANELAQYENICKLTKDNLRAAVTSRDKETLRQKQLIDIKTKFSANSSAADSELLKAKLEVNRTNKEIDEIIEKFEKQKLIDIKRILLDFIMITIKQNTKAMEVLTAAYYDIINIDEKKDFSDFKKLIKFKGKTNSTILRRDLRSQSMESLEASKSMLSPLRKRREKITRSTKDLTKEETITEDDGTIDDDDEDYDDDDDDDVEDDVSEESDRGKDSKPGNRKLGSSQQKLNRVLETEDDDDDEEDDDNQNNKALPISKVSSIPYSVFQQTRKYSNTSIPITNNASISRTDNVATSAVVRPSTKSRLVTVESTNDLTKSKKIIDCTKRTNT